MKKIVTVALVILILSAGIACKQKAVKAESPAGYDLAHPTIFNMPDELEEISGIAFKKGNADTIFAEQDEEGKLFYFHLGDKEITHTKFGKKGDYEDVAICNNYVVMLRSDGVLFTFPFNAIYEKKIETANEQAGLLPEGEYEAMYADEAASTVYVLCKNCGGDKQNQVVTGHVLSLGADGKLTAKNDFTINTKPVADLTSEKDIHFKPSAMAKNPLTNEWYIVASVNKTLLITDAQWKPLKTFQLNPALFVQPEGIAFDKAGNLYISNEKGTGNYGTVFQFLYNKK